MQWLIVVLAIVPQILTEQPSAGSRREWPGACRQACCGYNGEWVAADAAQAFAQPQLPGDPATAPVFEVRAGERVRALTGTLFTLEPGAVRIDEDFSTDGTYGDFSKHHRRIVTLNAGETRALFAIRTGGLYRVMHRGTIIDARLPRVGTPEACSRAKPTCAAVVIKPPITRWWVMVMNAEQKAGWIEEPARFAMSSPCR